MLRDTTGDACGTVIGFVVNQAPEPRRPLRPRRGRARGVQLHILQHLDEAVRCDLVMGPEGPALPNAREPGGFIKYVAVGGYRRF